MISEIARYFLGFILGRKILPKEMQVGEGTFIAPTVKLDPLANGRLISFGKQVTVCNGVRIICHDASSNRRINATWVAPVRIGDRAYIGAASTILPGVVIGNDAIIAAGAIVAENVPEGEIFAGIPARKIGETKRLDNERLNDIKLKKTFSATIYGRSRIGDVQVEEMLEAAKRDGGFYIVSSTKEKEI